MNLVEKTVTCPYDKAHQILPYRMQTHLKKCRIQHENQSDHVTCPMNATHIVLEPELQYHIHNCPDKIKVDSYVYRVGTDVDLKPLDQQIQEIQMPASSENWDDEPEIPGPKSYLDIIDEVIINKNVMRDPVGKSKAQRRQFRSEESYRLEELRDEAPVRMARPSTSKPGPLPLPTQQSHVMQVSKKPNPPEELQRSLNALEINPEPKPGRSNEDVLDLKDQFQTVQYRGRGIRKK